MKRVMLYSGGLDSYIASWLMRVDELVYIRIGAPYEARELEHLTVRARVPVRLVSGVPWLGGASDDKGRVPLRNMHFAMTAAVAAEADEVILVALAGETSGDKSRKFARKVTAAMTASEGRKIRLRVPYRGVTKTGLVRRYVQKFGTLAAGYNLTQCPSCYAADLPPYTAGCGQCMSCVRRWVAMSLNGIQEKYVSPPWEYQTGKLPSDWWKYVRRTPLFDWFGIIRNNRDLLRALRLRRS